MQKLYFASMPVSLPANVFIYMFVEHNRNIDFVKPCKSTIVYKNSKPVGIHYADKAPYVLETEEYFGCNFRAVNWINQTDYLEYILKKYYPQSVWFASFDPNQIAIIKQKFTTNVVTISFNHAKSDYKFIKAKWQELADFDIDILAETYTPADIEINTVDLYNKTNFLKLMNNLNAKLSLPAWNIYSEIIK